MSSGKSRPLALINVPDTAKCGQIKALCEQLKIDVKELSMKDIGTNVGALCGAAPMKKKNVTREKMPELMIFYGFVDGLLDTFLYEYKGRGISPVSLKAIVTAHNIGWSLGELCDELARERTAMIMRARK